MVIEIASSIAGATTFGFAVMFYFKSRRLLAENEVLRGTLHAEVEDVISATKKLSTTVIQFEDALKIASKTAFKEALAESILVVRTASAVELKNKASE